MFFFLVESVERLLYFSSFLIRKVSGPVDHMALCSDPLHFSPDWVLSLLSCPPWDGGLVAHVGAKSPPFVFSQVCYILFACGLIWLSEVLRGQFALNKLPCP